MAARPLFLILDRARSDRSLHRRGRLEKLSKKKLGKKLGEKSSRDLKEVRGSNAMLKGTRCNERLPIFPSRTHFFLNFHFFCPMGIFHQDKDILHYFA